MENNKRITLSVTDGKIGMFRSTPERVTTVVKTLVQTQS